MENTDWPRETERKPNRGQTERKNRTKQHNQLGIDFPGREWPRNNPHELTGSSRDCLVRQDRRTRTPGIYRLRNKQSAAEAPPWWRGRYRSHARAKYRYNLPPNSKS